MKFIYGILLGFFAGWLFWKIRRRSEGAQFQPTPRVLVEESKTEARQPAATRAKKTPAARERADNLQEITGIGPVIARRLEEAGIRTFDALSREDPERLREIANSPAVDAESWIEQARQLKKQ